MHQTSIVRVSAMIVLLLVCFGSSFSQDPSAISVTNYNTLIYIQPGTDMYIGGNYTDNNSQLHGVDPNDPRPTPKVLDAPILLSGNLYIGGNIENNSGTETKLIYEYEYASVEGAVILTGANQSISGSVDCYFPNLTLNMSGTLTLNRDITIDNNLTFTSGDLNLNGRNVQLMNFSEIVGEGNTNSIYGSTGTVTTATYTINPDDPTDPQNAFTDYRGIGVGYTINNHNLASVKITRMHGPGNTYRVADGIHTLRVYKFETVTPATGPVFTTLRVEYNAALERNGFNDADLALYISKDEGSTWIKKGTSTSTGAITASDVEVTAGINLFAIAPATCSVGNTPTANLKFFGDDAGASMNICEENSFDLKIDDAIEGTYYSITRSRTNPVRQDGVEGTAAVTYPFIQYMMHDDEGTFSSFVRNQRGCEGVDVLVVDVKDKPVANFNVLDPLTDNVAMCMRDVLTFNDLSVTSDGPIDKWTWTFDDAADQDSVIQNPEFAYTDFSDRGINFPELKIETQFGCRDTVNNVIVIQTLPVPSFTMHDVSNAEVTEICEDIDVYYKNHSAYLAFNDVATAALTYRYRFGDNVTSTEKDPVHAIETSGNYTIWMRAKVSNTGCYDSISRNLWVKPEPIPSFTARVDESIISEVCAGVYVEFRNASTMPDNTPITFQWDFDGGNPATSEVSPVRQFEVADLYSVNLTAYSTQHGCFEDFTSDLLVHPPPTGDFTIADSDICLDEEAVFTNNSQILYGTMTYEWEFADGNTSNSDAATLNHAYDLARQYNVKLTRTSNFGCTNSFSRTLIVHPMPVASFTQLNVCDGEKVGFYNTSIIQSDEIESYQWDFGDGNSSGEFQPEHKFPGYGTYDVSLVATSDFGCVDDYTGQVQIYQRPSFNLGASVAGCDQQYLIDPSSGSDIFLPANSAYSWFDSRHRLISNEETFLVTTQGVYSVNITSPAPQSCDSTIYIPVFLFKPVALGNDVIACEKVILDAESGLTGEKSRADNTLYEWRKNGVVISDQQVLIVTEPGTYSVSLTRITAGSSCTTTDEINIDIEIPLTLTLPAEIISCEGQNLVLDAGVDVLTYRWTNVDSGEELGTEKTLSVASSGNYKVEVASASCTASTVTQVEFSPPPVVSFQVAAQEMCEGKTITFTDYSFANIGTIASTQWEFGDNTTATDLSNIDRAYGVAGTYLVRLTATSNHGCESSYEKTLVIEDTPIAAFTFTDACANEDINIQNNSSALSTFEWTFGDDTFSSAANPSKTFNTGGDYNIQLLARKGNCTATAEETVTIHALPTLEFGSEVTTCGTSLNLDAGNGGSTYRWFSTADNSTLATTQQYVVNVDGEIGLEISNTSGCTISDIATVRLNTPLNVDLGNDRSVCDEETLYPGYFPNASFLWSDNSVNSSLDVTSSGTYQVSVTDQNGCTGSSDVVLQVLETPEITLEHQELCEGSQLLLDPGTNTSYSYAWSTGATSPNISVTNGGNYSVTVSNGICSDFASVTVTLNQTPSADFTAASVCAGNSVTFNNTSTFDGAGVVNYLWALGDNTFAAVDELSKVYGDAGSYNVTLQAISEKNCTGETTKPVNIYHEPVAQFTANDGCTNVGINFDNSSTFSGTGSLTYDWNFDNGQSSADFEPTFAYDQPGSYWVSLQVTSENGCADSFVNEVKVGVTPTLNNWQNEVSSCNTNVILDAGNAGSVYLWSDGSTGQTLTTSESGNYSVNISSADGCSVEAQSIVDFNNQVEPVLADSYEECGSVFLDPNVQAATYLWSTGAQTQTILALTSADYWIQVISNDLCIGRDTAAVIVNPIPEFTLGSDIEACDKEILTLKANPQVEADYLWSDGSSGRELTISSTGNYSLRLTTIHGCTFQDDVHADFYALPVLTFDPQITACGNLLLDAGNEGSTYKWSDGSVARTNNIIQSGTYSVEVVNIHQCVNRDTVSVTILPLPVISLGNDITICNGETTTLDAGDGRQAYRWSDNSTSRYLTIGSTGNYTATVTDDLGCSQSDEISITVRPPLGLDLGENRLLCNNEGIFLTAGITANSYQWGSNTGFTSSEKEIRPSLAGTYWVKVTDDFNCTQADTVSVTPTTENINAMFLVPSVVDKGDMVHFAMLTEPQPTEVQWLFSDGGMTTEVNPAYFFFQTGEFDATLIVSNGVCTDTLTKTIVVRDARTVTDPDPSLPELIDIVNADQFPNPTNGVINLHLLLTSEADARVGVVSLRGVIIEEKQKKLKEDIFEFDISNQSNGIYLVRIIVENRLRVIKVLKSESR